VELLNFLVEDRLGIKLSARKPPKDLFEDDLFLPPLGRDRFELSVNKERIEDSSPFPWHVGTGREFLDPVLSNDIAEDGLEMREFEMKLGVGVIGYFPDQPSLFQSAEMMSHRAGADMKGGGQLLAALGLIGEQTDDPEPGRVSKCLEEADHLWDVI